MKGFGRRPLARRRGRVRLRPAFESLRRRKPRSGKGAGAAYTVYGDLRMVSGRLDARGEDCSSVCGIWPPNGGLGARGRISFGCLWWLPRGLHGVLEQSPSTVTNGPRSETATLGYDRRLDTDHDVSILIRPVDAGRRAAARPNVSTTIMRPPQHGQGSEGLGGSASSSGGDCVAAASNWRARAMF